MNGLLLLTGGILLIAIFALVYRILSLIKIARGNADSRDVKSNGVNSFLFIVFFFVGFPVMFWYSMVARDNYLPEAASEHGVITDDLFWITTGVVFFVFVATHALLMVSPYFFRFKEGRKALWYPDNTKLEVAWTVVPAIVLTVLVITGWLAWSDITAPAPADRVEVEIMGKQFNWQVRYAGKDGVIGKYDFRKIDATNSFGMDFTNDKANFDDFTPREIHIPKGKNVLLKIRARDVLHSVYMPHFRVKMDAVPGMPTSFWFVPTKTTQEMRDELSKDPNWQVIDPKTGEPRYKNFNYELACTEVCGSGHFAMRMIIVVDELAEYEKWYASQEPWAVTNKDYLAGLKLDASKEQLAKAGK
jgi:cytochrome c oxidase subunit 2